MNNVEKELLKLLDDYSRYKFMTRKFWDFRWYAGINLGDFLQWLKSRNY